MKELIIIVGFPKCGTSVLLYYLRNNYINIGENNKNEEICDNILDLIPKINNMEGDKFICKQPTLVYRDNLLKIIKDQLDKFNIKYKIILLIREHSKQLQSLFNMRKNQKYYTENVDTFLEEKYICYHSKKFNLNITNIESINFKYYIEKLINIFDKKYIYLICQENLYIKSNNNNNNNELLNFLEIDQEKYKNYKIDKYKNNYDLDDSLNNILKKKVYNEYNKLIEYIKSNNIKLM